MLFKKCFYMERSKGIFVREKIPFDLSKEKLAAIFSTDRTTVPLKEMTVTNCEGVVGWRDGAG